VSDDAEVVIVGAGVAGASMAIVLARLDVSVLMLEKSAVHVDRIRGESITPWGVEEAQNLGVLDILTNAGGHFTSRLVLYGEDISPESARSRAINLSALVPNVPGTLKIGHPRMCQALNEGAVSVGATLLRGIDNLEVAADTTPQCVSSTEISFTSYGRAS
jgi:flavin-dependent dehydrogenase